MHLWVAEGVQTRSLRGGATWVGHGQRCSPEEGGLRLVVTLARADSVGQFAGQAICDWPAHVAFEGARSA
jgi:hypothetical protein